MDEPQTLGQQLAARRVPKQWVCGHCGREFTSLARARYCSQTCRQKAYMRRRAAQHPA